MLSAVSCSNKPLTENSGALQSSTAASSSAVTLPPPSDEIANSADESSPQESKAELPDFGEVTADNYSQVIQEHFGLDIASLGVTVTSAKSMRFDSENRDIIRINADISDDTVLAELAETIFNKTLELSGGVTWDDTYDWDYEAETPTRIIDKGDPFASYQEYYDSYVESCKKVCSNRIRPILSGWAGCTITTVTLLSSTEMFR